MIDRHYGHLARDGRRALRTRIEMKGTPVPSGRTPSASVVKLGGVDGAVDRVEGCGGGWSRCCRRWSGGFATRAGRGCPKGRPYREFCLCCIRGSFGGICPWSSASARARPATAAWTSDRRRACERLRPRKRPELVTADGGYDHDSYRRQLSQRGSRRRSPAARQSTAPAWAVLAAYVERTFAWVHHLKRLLDRYDRRHEIHEAFLAFGGYLVCFRRLRRCS
jgi:hypothetical protein